MSLEQITGKPSPPPENVTVRPEPESAPELDGTDPSMMTEDELVRAIMLIRQRGRRMSIFSGAPQAGKLLTQYNV